MSGIFKPPFGARLKLDHPLARGLVGCWLFNEGSGDKVHDYSGQGNVGTLSGFNDPPIATSGWNAGPHGGAFAFDGVNDVCVTTFKVPILTPEDSFSWVFMVNRSSVSDVCIIGNRGGGQPTPLCFMKIDSMVRYYVSGDVFSLSSFVPNSQWASMALVKNQTTFTMYRDAVPRGSATGVTTTMASNPFYIGAGYTNGVEAANCIISSVSLYNRALSVEEIALLYAQPYCMFEDSVYKGEWPRPTVFNESLLLQLSAGVTRESVQSAVEVVAFAVNAIESRSARTEMDVGLSLGIAAEQGTDKNLTASVLAELVAAAGMSQESVHSLQEAVAMAAAVGVDSLGKSIIANALVLHATASMISASVGSLSASLNLDTSVGAAFGMALILQASVLLGAAGGLSASGGISVDEAAALGMNAGMAQVTRLLLSEAVTLNAQASQAQAATMTAEEQAALAIACDQIDAAFLDSTNYVSRSLSVLAGMQQWGIVPRIAAARHLYNALARKREYDAKERKREYDAAARKREYGEE